MTTILKKEYDRNADLGMTYGCCRSGRRWFWAVSGWNRRDFNAEPFSEHGWCETEDQGVIDAQNTIARLADGRTVQAERRQGTAYWSLKKLNKAKRAARPPADSSDSRAIQYMYNYRGTERFRIVKRTKQRIYYIEQIPEYRWVESTDPLYPLKQEFVRFVDLHGNDAEIRFADIRKVFQKRDDRDPDDEIVATNGKRKWQYYWCFFQEQPPKSIGASTKDTKELVNNLSKLKSEMAAAHPDKGGSCDAFREARERYVEARELCGI